MLKKYIFYRKKLLALLFLFFVIFFTTFYFYGFPFEAVLYPTVVCLFIGIIVGIFDYFFLKGKCEKLEILSKTEVDLLEELPEASNLTEEYFKEIINNIRDEKRRSEQNFDNKYNDMVNYYTIWAHQIKTPISAMRLNLQNSELPNSIQLQNDLSRIESYVNMVLTFLRLDSSSTDYIFKEYDLDKMIKESVKKFSGEFIAKKLSFYYSPCCIKVLTDEKWFSFVLEQIISNAVKYTEKGSISVYTADNMLCIKDTGIGITASDLPRIFENGYTGLSGRNDKKATGIGLYLVKRICDNLGHRINITSEIGVGTTVRLSIDRESVEVND